MSGLTDDDLKAVLRGRLDGTPAGKQKVARSIGVTGRRLSCILRSSSPVPDRVVGALGFRKVVQTRFERIE